RVLDAGRALDHRLGEVTELPETACHQPQREQLAERCRREIPELGDDDAEHGASERAPEADHGFLRTDSWMELLAVLAEKASGEVAARVGEPRQLQRQEHIEWAERAIVAAQQGEATE